MRRIRRSLLLRVLMGHPHCFDLRLHASFERLRVVFVLHVLGRVQCRQVDIAAVAHRAANYLMLVDGSSHLHARRWRLLLIASRPAPGQPRRQFAAGGRLSAFLC